MFPLPPDAVRPSTAADAMKGLNDLHRLIEAYPLIDNHAHPLLKPSRYSEHPLESITSEAHGPALKDTKHTLAHLRAVNQLARVLGCNATWESIKGERDRRNPVEWTKICLDGVQALLLDDGLDNISSTLTIAEHDAFTKSKSKRIVRIEWLAESVLEDLLLDQEFLGTTGPEDKFDMFLQRWDEKLQPLLEDKNVVGFKSVLCYRGGLGWSRPMAMDDPSFNHLFMAWFETSAVRRKHGERPRLDNAHANHWILQQLCMELDERRDPRPLQFHTGLGDNDINLLKSNPAYLEGLIKAFPHVQIVLLHSSYPYTREAGYLASVYENVYLDFGEVFPMLSKDGQKSVVKEMMELTPVNKLLWSSDGHWFPETYLIANMQIREVMREVLTKKVEREELSLQQAADMVKMMFFENSNRLYRLNLVPEWNRSPITPNNITTFSGVFSNFPKTRFLRLQWVDHSGVLRLRVVPISKVQSTFKNFELGMTKASLSLLPDDTPAADMTASGRYSIVPDWVSIRPCDAFAPGHTSVMATILAPGGELSVDPRTALSNAISAAKDLHELEFLVGFETEVVFFMRKDDGSLKSTPQAHAWSCSSSLLAQQSAIALDEIVTALDEAGIEVIMYHPESADGQFEVVTGPLEPMAAVDALYFTRETIRGIAAKHGMHATLHPKAVPNQTGTAAHTHFSLTKRKEKQDSFVAGVLEHLRAICAFGMPTLSSYDRLADNCWAGGTYVCWGDENRETPLRRINGEDAHWEIRCVDGTANMYLFVAALIDAGITGVSNGSKLSAGCDDNPAKLTAEQRKQVGVTKRVPMSLPEALQALREDSAMVAGLGQDLVNKFVAIKEAEIGKFGDVTKEERWKWEVERY